ncbi:hypothetical protein [Gellertiella hungarica]|uniref:Arc/MetJ-type ribon-helix-helix transcriptional regulator n=1 Tax=Gellertiella hungarica TaxID=1572859 RepID=A0A7W6J8V9_9HYPH|nr:hypothetical protein [Gellertiella hungarica]MBB4066945.1 Arc/MetJ-type ribon-helix-helix transcriptional regulator [Gellertiella hungarica]
MAEPRKKTMDLVDDVETLRRLWDEGVASGPPKELDFDEFLRKAEENLAKEKRDR